MRIIKENILIILHFGALGGAQRQAIGLAKFLVEKRSCNVDLLLMHSDFQTEEFKAFVIESGIRNVLHFKNPYLYLPKEYTFKNLKRIRWNFLYLNKVRKGLKPYNYSFVIPYLNHTSKLAFFIYKMLPSVKFTFWHQLGLDILKHDWIERIVIKGIPCVIGNAPNCFDIFKNELYISQTKCYLLPQNISLKYEKRNSNNIRFNLNISKDKIIIGMIAHYRSDKYFDLLLDAFIDLVPDHDNIHLVFLGNKMNDDASSVIYKSLQNKVSKNDLTNYVSVLSEFDVIDILNVLDIGVLVSQIEGMPNTVMEYMQYGLPCIVSNHPGCVQLLEDSPFLIENNKELLSFKLIELIDDFDLRIKEGNMNKKRIIKFDIKSYVENLENIINTYDV